MADAGANLLYAAVGVVVVASSLLSGVLAAIILEELTGEYQPIWTIVMLVGALSYLVGAVVVGEVRGGGGD